MYSNLDIRLEVVVYNLWYPATLRSRSTEELVRVKSTSVTRFNLKEYGRLKLPYGLTRKSTLV